MISRSYFPNGANSSDSSSPCIVSGGKLASRSPIHSRGGAARHKYVMLNAVDVRENDVRRSSAWVYGYALDLAEALKDGADIGLVSF